MELQNLEWRGRIHRENVYLKDSSLNLRVFVIGIFTFEWKDPEIPTTCHSPGPTRFTQPMCSGPTTYNGSICHLRR